MVEHLPPPLVQRDVNVTLFPYMPLDIQRLMTSSTWIKAAKQGRLGHILVCLWCEAFRQIPGGSLPNDDDVLARLCMCDLPEWKEYRDRALSGFTLHSDNRYYHAVVAEKVINAHREKMARKARTQAATDAKKVARDKKQKRRNGHAT